MQHVVHWPAMAQILTDVGANEFKVGLSNQVMNVSLCTGGLVIQAGHLPTKVQQVFAKMRSQEPCTYQRSYLHSRRGDLIVFATSVPGTPLD